MPSPSSSPILPKLEPLIGAEDICERLDISRQTLRRLVRDKKFPQPVWVSKTKHAWRVKDVEAWIAAGGLSQYA